MLSALLTVLIPMFVVGEMPRTQEASSGATSTKHDAVIKGTVTSANGKRLKKAHVTLVNLSTEENCFLGNTSLRSRQNKVRPHPTKSHYAQARPWSVRSLRSDRDRAW